MWWFRRCPADERLHDYAARPAEGRVAAHVARCATCRARVEALGGDERLLAELRRALETGDLDPQRRARILRTCQRTAGEADAPPPASNA